MATTTERKSIAKIQKHIAAIKKIAKKEMDDNMEAGHAVHAQAWYKALVGINVYHMEQTDNGLEAFPEFFGEVVTGPSTRGGGGGR